jgi:hypothetical protein
MCNGCLTGAALDRYVAALNELATRRHTRQEVAVHYDVPLELLPKEGEP